MKRIMYPGSFDPFTNGHLDLVQRASRLFDKVVVAVAVNSGKSPMFTLEERRDLIQMCCRHLENVEVVFFEGLLVEAVKRYQIQAILRGLRAFSDFENELQMALMNRSMDASCETVFMMPSEGTSFISSHLVKEVAQLGGHFEHCLPVPVAAAVREKLRAGKTAEQGKI